MYTPYMTSRRIKNTGIVHANAFMIFGGKKFGGSERLSSTEIVSEEGQVTPGPEMPTAVSHHEIAGVNATTSILTGGQTNANLFSPQTWYFNHVSQEFQPGPSLITGRRGHASGTIQDQETKEDIVAVVGGYKSNADGTLDSTELLINGEWIQGISNYAKIMKCVCFLHLCGCALK